MKKDRMKILTNNIGLKLTSVAVAIVIWLIVVNIDDPITTKRISGVAVQVLNESYVEKSGLMCMQTENTGVTTVTLTGRRKTLQKITSLDLTATADLRQAVSLETTPVMIPISVTCKGIESDKIQVSPPNMAITLEEKQTQEFLVNINSQDCKPGKGYEIGTMYANPEKVRITGPASLIRKIDRVVAYTSMNGIIFDRVEQVNITVIDKNQEEFTDAQMKYLRFDNSSVNIFAKLWKVKTDVKIVGEVSGAPKDGYEVGTVTMTPASVGICGTEEALALIKEQGNCIRIPSELLNVKGKSEDFEIKVDLTGFLPENSRLAADTQSTVLVNISILPAGSRDFSVQTVDIAEYNVPENFDAVFETEKINVRIQAEEGYSLEDLEQKDIRISIDLEGREEGTYTIPLEVELPEGYRLVSEAEADVSLMAISESEGTEKDD